MYPDPERRQRIVKIIVITAIIAALALWILFSIHGYRPAVTAAEVQTGRSYLEQLNAKDPSEAESQVRQIRKQRLDAQRLEKVNEMLNGDVNVWSLFQDYVILGDSRSVGLYTWGYLPHERVLAEGGATILYAEEHLDDIKAINPTTIILAFGLNDVSIGIWPTPTDYVEEYSKVLDEIQAELPDATIFVNSIFPAVDPAFEKSSAWRNIPEYNTALKEMCEYKGVPYIDNDEIAAENVDDYETDGIHFRTPLYELWAKNMIRTIYTWDGSDVADTAGTDNTGTSGNSTDTAGTDGTGNSDTEADGSDISGDAASSGTDAAADSSTDTAGTDDSLSVDTSESDH